MTERTRWEDQADRFRELLNMVAELHNKKGKDYGTSDDQYYNIRASQDFGIPAWLGAVMRANDKMARIKTYCKKGKLENESLQESILDGTIYHIKY